MQPQPPAALANETWYMFGDTRGGRWDQVRGDAPCVHSACRLTRLQLLNELPPAPMDGELHDPAVTFGLAGMLSGVSFHTHGAVFAEVRQVRPRLRARVTWCMRRCSTAKSCGSCPRRPTSPCSTATSRRCRWVHPAHAPFCQVTFCVCAVVASVRKAAAAVELQRAGLERASAAVRARAHAHVPPAAAVDAVVHAAAGARVVHPAALVARHAQRATLQLFYLLLHSRGGAAFVIDEAAAAAAQPLTAIWEGGWSAAYDLKSCESRLTALMLLHAAAMVSASCSFTQPAPARRAAAAARY